MRRFSFLLPVGMALALPLAVSGQTPHAPRPAAAPRPVLAARPEPTVWSAAIAPTPPLPDLEMLEWPVPLDDFAFVADEARLALAELRIHDVEARLFDVDAALTAPIAALAEMTVSAPMAPMAPMAPQDPADSLYRIARETLNRSEYRRAAQLFHEMRTRYPRSAYVSEAAYWEAFALYRIGATQDLRNALAVFDQQATFTRKATQANAAALTARVLGALARQGDPSAKARVAQAARNGDRTCDTEDLMVRAEALNALTQLDRAAAAPLLRKVLERRDACSASLRRNAVMLVGRGGGADALAVLGDVATKDPSSSVRRVAISLISQEKGDEAVAVLERMLRSQDDGVRRSAARALARRSDARSRRAIHAYIESPQTGESQKAEAILGFNREGSSPEDVAFLRTMYGRTDSERVRSAIISVLPRLAPGEGRKWLLSIARDGSQPTSSRSVAIAILGRDTSLTVPELAGIYDAANERRIREQVVLALARRNEPAATDKLIDIARNGTDPVVRSSAINRLSRKNDPRLAALLRELIDR